MSAAAPMTGPQAIDALQRDDREALGGAAFTADVAPAIEAALGLLGAPARLLAPTVLLRAGGAGAGRALLALSGDDDPLVSVSACEALLELDVAALPPATFLCHSIAVRRHPRTRRLLYRVLARTGDASALPALRALYDQERDARALRKAHVAAIRLGRDTGQAAEERRAFAEGLARVAPRDVLDAEEDLVDAADPSLLRAAAVWFEDGRVAMRIGTHAREEDVRVADVAVRAAARLGIAFEAVGATRLRRMERAVIDAARAAVLALPLDLGREVRGPRLGAPLAAPLLRAPTPERAPLPGEPPPRPTLDTLRARAPEPAPLPPTAEVALGAGAPSTPFVPAPPAREPRPAPRKPRFDTGTQDIEKAKAAAMADAPTPFARQSAPPPAGAGSPSTDARRAPSPTRPPEGAAQRSLSLEQYAWICALLAAQSPAAQGALQGAGLTEPAWRDVHARWQAWLATEPARWHQFQALLAEYQRRARP